jgi:hypothetical protein
LLPSLSREGERRRLLPLSIKLVNQSVVRSSSSLSAT